MSDRVSWIEHKGVRILYADYSRLSEEEYIEVIEEFKNELLKQPPGSVATLTNVTDSTVTNKVKDKLKELSEQSKGISKGAAAIGVTGFKKAIATFIRKDLYWADSLEEAKEWLAEQSS
jgi:flagellar motor switch protein FliG